MLQGPYVFLSYRSFEREFAAKLAGDLRNAGVNVWMDALDTGIAIGDDWPRRLQDAIDQCSGLICVLSPDYVNSTYCRRELQRADQRGVPLVPLLLHSLGDNAHPIQLEGIQHLDFVQWRHPQTYARQYQRLESELQRKLSPIFGAKPDEEARYLNALLARLGTVMGVLEYTELATQIVDRDVRPRPWSEDEWGYSVLRSDSDARSHENQQYASIAEVSQAHSRFVLIGAPGAGKSTMLRRLARDAALRRQERPRSSALPLVLDLSEWLPRQSLRDFVRAGWPFAGDPIAAISSGDVSVFLDGLNEMGGSGGRNAAQLRDWLGSPDGPKTIVVTCRANEYEGALALGDVPTVQVRELQPQQITLFAQRYLQDAAPVFLRQLGVKESGYGEFDRGLLALARNPYFLRSLIEVFTVSQSQDLPRNAGVLLDRLTAALWERERRRRTSGLVPLATLRVRCARVARALLDENKPLQIPIGYAERKATRWFEALWRRRAALRLFRSAASAGLMTIDATNVRFNHQLVQEYFAALSFIDASGHVRMEELAPMLRDIWMSRENTFIAVCGLVREPEAIVRLAFARGVRYAGACLASGVVVSDALKSEIVAALIGVVGKRPVSGLDARAAAEALGLIGDVGVAGTTALGDLLLQDEFLSRDEAAIALSRLGTRAAAVELYRALGRLGSQDEYLAAGRNAEIIARLADMGEVAIPELIDVLARPPSGFGSRMVRDSAMRGLQRVGASAVPALLELLRTGRADAKLASARVLAQLQVPEAVPLMIDALAAMRPAASLVPHEWQEAFKAIGDGALPDATSQLESPSAERRLIGLKALGAIGTAGTIPHLIPVLEDPEFSVRFEAGMALSRMGAAAVPALLEFLRHATPTGIASAAFTLSSIQDARAIPDLRKLLGHCDDAVRSHAAFALGKLGDRSSETDLAALLEDSTDVAKSAAWSLGELKSASAVASLVRCLDRRTDEKLRNEVALSLEKVGSRPALEAAMRYWREALSRNYHSAGAGEALGRLKDASAVPLLMQAMKDGPEFARSAYVKALASIGDASAVPAIIERLHDRDSASTDPMHIAQSAIEALGVLKDTRAIEPLTRMLTREEPVFLKGRIGDLAAQALQSIGTPEALTRAGAHWQTALASSDVKIRLLGAESLATLRYEPATDQLITALADQEETGYYDKRTVGDAAAEALELIGGPVALAALTEHWCAELGSERVRGRVLALNGLGRLGIHQAESGIIELLGDTYSYKDRHVADYAVDVLKRFPSSEARAAVAKYLERQKRPSQSV